MSRPVLILVLVVLTRVSGADISLALACSLLVDVHFFNATLRCTRYVTTQHLLRI